MFDYACITEIHDYLKSRFPGAFVRGFAGAISRFGDAHVFEVGEDDQASTLIVSHRFLAEIQHRLVAYLDEREIPARLRVDGCVVVGCDGVVQARPSGRVTATTTTVGRTLAAAQPTSS